MYSDNAKVHRWHGLHHSVSCCHVTLRVLSCRTLHCRYPPICLHRPNHAYFASAFLENSSYSLHVQTELENVQGRYKRYFDQSVCVTPTFLQGQYLFYYHPSEQLTPAARLTREPRSKLLSKAFGPFRIISTTLDAVNINKDVIHNTAFTDHATRAPDRTDETNQTDKTNTSKKMHESPFTRLSRNDGIYKAE